METMVAYFLSLPNVAIYAIFGAIGGALGSLVGSVISRVLRKPSLAKIVALIFVVLAIQLPKHVLPQLKSATAPTQIVQELKNQRLFEVIFRLHPEAEEEFKLQITDVINSSPSDQVFLRSQAVSAGIVDKYLNKHMVAASDEITYQRIVREANVLEGFISKPELCVSYYLGKPQFSKNDITPEFLAEELNLKADLIESSINNPSLPPRAASIDEIFSVIAEKYQMNGYDLQGLSKIDQIASLQPTEGCRIALDFMRALASMEQKQAAYVFKNLLYIGGQP